MRPDSPNPLLWSNASCSAPVVAVGVVLAATAAFNARIGLDHVTVSAGGLSSGDAVEVTRAGTDLAGVASQLLARLGWAVTGIALLVMTLTALLGALVALVRWVRVLGRRQGLLFLAAALALLAAVATGRILGLGGEWLISEPAVLTDLRGVTLYDECVVFDPAEGGEPDAAEAGETDDPDPCADGAGRTPEAPEDLERAAMLEDRLVDLAYLAFALLLAAAAASLVVPGGGYTPQQRRHLLVERARGLRWLLYLGSGVLVLHALEMYAFYRWPGAWLPAEEAALVERMAHGVSTANGAFFSLLLLALYLPAAGLMRLRGLALLRRDAPGAGPAERQRQARAEGLLASPLRELGNLLLALGPLLAGGPLAGALDQLAL